MSDKIIKMSQLTSISEQIDTSIYRKKRNTQLTRNFFKQLPPITRFQKSIDDKQQFRISSSKRVKTEQIVRSKRELSPSDRQISRFIYKHLHKKIAFQQKLYGDLDCASNDLQTPEKMDSLDTNQRPNIVGSFGIINKMKPHIYGYQKTNNSGSKNVQFKKTAINIKQRIMKNQLQRSNMLNVSITKRRYKKQAHIDAYFDLSCLQNVKEVQEKSLLLTNSEQKQ